MESRKENKLRYNILIAIVYIIGIILLLQLFNLQIVNGQEYREESNTRLTRETTIKAARGNILDSSGEKLVSTKLVYNVEIYKTKVDNQTLNNALLLFAQTLEQNGDTYVDNFPITVEPYAFKNETTAQTFKEQNKLDSSYDAEACFNYFKSKYEVTTENVQDARKIITLRYEIEKDGYSNTKSVELASNISNGSLAKLNEMSSSFPGINTTSEPTLYYPYGLLASHILGYVGPISEDELKANPDDYDQNDITGKTGIEQVLEKYLKGTDGIKQIDMSVDGIVTDEYIAEEAKAGADVMLTIDASLQKITEDALEKNIQMMQNGELKDAQMAKEGAAVVLNVKTGEILAMASYPNYDPSLFIDGISTENWNNYLNAEDHPLMNKAISSISPPGSTFKMVTAIAGLESGAIDVNTKINDTGVYRFYKDYQPRCWKSGGHGWLNVTKAIEVSCNYFFYETGRRTGIDRLVQVASAFGLGQKTGIELPGEEAGVLASRDTMSPWVDGYTVQAAIGQLNNSFTPLQMAKYVAMVANGGKNLDVTIIKSVTSSDGTEISKDEIENYVNEKLGISGNSGSDINISDENIKAVKEGMRGVTSDGSGTAYSYFKDFNVEVGGKTGSATTDTNGNANAWFVGFAPYDDPEIAVAVYIKDGQHGASTAVTAREIFAQYFGMNSASITEDMTAVSDMQTVR